MKHLRQMGFNALNRAIYISTLKQEAEKNGVLMFQCPQSGYLHFYGEMTVLKEATGQCFNALNRAIYTSTRRKR